VTFSDKAPADADDWQTQVAQVFAEGDVLARLEDGAVVQADQLIADNTRQTARLTGKPVRITRADARVKIERLDIADGGDRAQAVGPGEFQSIRPGRTDDDPRRTLTVRWSEGMKYDDPASTLDVRGKVEVEHSDRPTELNRLTADELALKLINASWQDTGGQDDAERKLLRELTARRNVVLLSTRWKTEARKIVAGRLRMSGPLLGFDIATEQARTRGAGSLLGEDYTDHKHDAKLGAIRVSGKGATLFSWTGRLLMDGRRADITFERDVNMTHRPADRDELIELRPGKLVADMTGLSGIVALSTSEIESLRIDHIEGVGAVQIRDAQRLISAHRLYYDGEAQTALLEAAPRRAVQVVKLDEPKPIRARQIIWDLARDRIEIERGGF
jgi:hypothetical protein